MTSITINIHAAKFCHFNRTGTHKVKSDASNIFLPLLESSKINICKTETPCGYETPCGMQCVLLHNTY